MSYALRITAPANTAVTNPVREVIPLPAGLLSRIDILFPKGHVGLTGLWFEYQGQQTLPQNVEHVYRGDNVLIPVHPELYINEPPYFMEILLYNLDDTYEHSCYLTFDFIPARYRSDDSADPLAALRDYFGDNGGNSSE